jgi:hypothetical protein
MNNNNCWNSTSSLALTPPPPPPRSRHNLGTTQKKPRQKLEQNRHILPQQSAAAPPAMGPGRNQPGPVAAKPLPLGSVRRRHSGHCTKCSPRRFETLADSIAGRRRVFGLARRRRGPFWAAVAQTTLRDLTQAVAPAANVRVCPCYSRPGHKKTRLDVHGVQREKFGLGGAVQ